MEPSFPLATHIAHFQMLDISSIYVSKRESPLCDPLFVPKLKFIETGILSSMALSRIYFIALIISVFLAKDSRPVSPSFTTISELS